MTNGPSNWTGFLRLSWPMWSPSRKHRHCHKGASWITSVPWPTVDPWRLNHKLDPKVQPAEIVFNYGKQKFLFQNLGWKTSGYDALHHHGSNSATWQPAVRHRLFRVLGWSEGPLARAFFLERHGVVTKWQKHFFYWIQVMLLYFVVTITVRFSFQFFVVFVEATHAVCFLFQGKRGFRLRLPRWRLPRVRGPKLRLPVDEAKTALKAGWGFDQSLRCGMLWRHGFLRSSKRKCDQIWGRAIDGCGHRRDSSCEGRVSWTDGLF